MDPSRLLRTLWFTPGINGRWGLNVVVTGKPGVGKTTRAGQEAGALGLHMETVIASLREPSDFLGLPIPMNVQASGLPGEVERALVPQVQYAAPAWAMRLSEIGRGVVLFDELNTAPPAVQAALLRCVLEGVVGDRRLPPGIRFFAAKNSVEDGGGYDLSGPMANRFGHIEWDAPSPDVWGDYMMGGADSVAAAAGTSAEALEAHVMKVWDVPFAVAKGKVIGFLRSRRELLMKMPEQASGEASGAYPSPRSWEMAVRAMAGAEVHGLSMAETDELVTAFVGRGAAKELAAYLNKMDLPDPAELLDGKVKFEADDRLDRTFAVLGSCTALVAPKDAAKRLDRAKALWNLLGVVAEKGSDLAVPSVRTLIREGLATGNKPLQEAAVPVLNLMAPVLKAAGYGIGKGDSK